MNRKVATKADLVRQVRTDVQVRDRFARHFGMDKTEVVGYFETLRLTRLQEDGTYTIYSVPEDGSIKMRTAELKKGEPVFVDNSGTPILLLRCGNPLTMGPADVVAENDIAPLLFGPPAGEAPEAYVLASAPEEVTLAEIQPPVPVLVEVPVTPPVLVPPTTITERPAPIATAGPNLAPLLGLAALAPFAGGGGGGALIPEPATLLAFATGLAVLGGRRLKRARSK